MCVSVGGMSGAGVHVCVLTIVRVAEALAKACVCVWSVAERREERCGSAHTRGDGLCVVLVARPISVYRCETRDSARVCEQLIERAEGRHGGGRRRRL